jgi:hypothetical protein
MKQSEVQKELNKFKKYVIKEARKNLTRYKKTILKDFTIVLKEMSRQCQIV